MTAIFTSPAEFSEALMNGMPAEPAEIAPFRGDSGKVIRTRNDFGELDDAGMDVPIANEDVLASPHFFGGSNAVAKLEEIEGRELSPIESKVAFYEGYVDATYLDSKGIRTRGAGQTGDFMGMPFSEVVKRKEKVVRRAVEGYDILPEEVQAELVQLAYRGDLRASNKWVKLLNEGKYEEASKELLDHKEYLKPETSSGIKRRLEAASMAIASLGGMPSTA